MLFVFSSPFVAAAEEEGGKPAAGVAETGERISANGIVSNY